MRGFSLTWIVAVAVVVCPSWAWAGNQEVAQELASALKNSGQLRGYKIGVRYQDGVAWLRGSVTDEQQKLAAERVVSQVPGVKQVINELAIVPAGVSDSANLQPVAGAIAPERTGASSGRSLASTQPQVGEVARSRVQLADPVPSVFAPEPVRPTAAISAMEGPTLAIPELPQADMPMATQTSATVSQDAAPRPIRPLPIAMTQQEAAREAAPAPAAQPLGRPLPMSVGAPGAAAPAPAAQPLGRPLPMSVGAPGAAAPARFDQPNMPNYAWPSYAAYPNYAAVTYPKQYSATAWPYIGPFYPYPQVPLGWRKVTLEWHDGWWFLDFDDGASKGPFSGLFRAIKGH